LIVALRPLFAAALAARRRNLAVVPRPIPAAPRMYMIVVSRPLLAAPLVAVRLLFSLNPVLPSDDNRQLRPKLIGLKRHPFYRCVCNNNNNNNNKNSQIIFS
jgi:hypothetical protein